MDGWTAWKGRLAIASVMCVAALGSACGDDSDGDDSATRDPNAKVSGTLNMWYSPSESTLPAWWKGFKADFEARYPDAELEITPYSTEEYITKLQAAFSAGEEPDVFEPSGPGEELHKFVRVGKIAALDGLADLSHYQRAAVEQYATGPNGEVYAVPRSKYVLNMWSNAEIFAEQGLEVPKTWDDLISACEQLSADGIIPIALGVGGQDQWTASHLYDSILYQYGGADVAIEATWGEDGPGWENPAIVEAADRFAELVEADCFPEGTAGLNYAQMSTLFVRGDAAMIFTGTWFAAQVAAAKNKFEVGLFPLPDGSGATHSTASLEGIVGGVGGFAASKRAADENPALVAAFLDFFGEKSDEYANDNGVVSVAANPKPAGGRLQKELSALGDTAKEIMPVTDVVTPPSVVDDYYANLQILATGGAPDEFAGAMEEAVAAERGNLPEPISR